MATTNLPHTAPGAPNERTVCHALGGAHHRCDSAPRWRAVRFGRGGKLGPAHRFCWCDAAVEEALSTAIELGEEVQVADEEPGPTPAPVREALVGLLREKLRNGQLGGEAQLRAAALTERFRRDVGLEEHEGRHGREGRTA